MENNWQRCSELLIALLAQRGDWLSALGQHENPEAAAELALETLDASFLTVLLRLKISFLKSGYLMLSRRLIRRGIGCIIDCRWVS